jgi:NADH-quinone oxidoreductase subunit N
MGTTASLAWFGPEIVLTIAIIAVVFFDLARTGRTGGNPGPGAGLLALAASALALLLTLGLQDAPAAWLFGRMIVLDGFAVFFKVLLGLSLLAAVWMSLTSAEVRGRPNEGEYYTVLLAAGLAMFLMASAANLLMAYLSLEFVSLSSYVLTGFLRHNRRSGEAALKYLIYGGVASGAMIYGMSWIFGLTGAMDYQGIAQGVAALDAGSRPALFLALVLVMTGFGYKIASVPFHMWAPDVYTGAPIPVTAFLAVGSKAAGFALLLRFFALGGLESATAALTRVPVVEMLSLLSILTMTVGNFAALSQTNMKRLLAYSSIAHAGYALLGVVVLAEGGLAAVLFYLAVYYVMNLGAFWIVMLVANATGREDIDAYRGLAWRRGGAVAAFTLAVFLFSLAGLPPLAGFVGKFLVFKAGVEGKLYTLVLIGLVNSVVSLYYYARVVKTMFLDAPRAGDAAIAFRPTDLGAVAALSVVTVVLGVRFNWLLTAVANARPVFPG